LVASDDESQFRRDGEHHVEVWHGQQQLALLLQPNFRAVCSTLRASSIATGVVLNMLRAASIALDKMTSKCWRAASCYISQGASMTRQHGSTEPRQVVRPVPANNVGKASHWYRG
jgi:hypothetical protein